MVPHLITALTGPINELEQRILDMTPAIERWFRLEWMEHTPPFYSSVDIRNAGFKLVDGAGQGGDEVRNHAATFDGNFVMRCGDNTGLSGILGWCPHLQVPLPACQVRTSPCPSTTYLSEVNYTHLRAHE